MVTALRPDAVYLCRRLRPRCTRHIDGENLVDLYNQNHDATRILERVAQEIDDLTERLEELTEDTPSWYARTRMRVEARATLEQVGELGWVLEDLGQQSSELEARGRAAAP
jgi:hypothetical protein